MHLVSQRSPTYGLFRSNVTDKLCITGKPSDDGASVSPVYSLATQHEGLWLLSGLESGGINLQSVRVDEGKIITSLRSHSSAVSVLNLAQDEQTVLSGSWDKTVLDWDLNTGKVIRSFESSGSQISALETRPLSNIPVPKTVEDVKPAKDTFSSDSAAEPRANGSSNGNVSSDRNPDEPLSNGVMNGVETSPTDSLFADNDSLFGENSNQDATLSGANFDEDDEFSKAIANGMTDQGHGPDGNQIDRPQDADGDIEMSLFGDVDNVIKDDDNIASASQPDPKENAAQQLAAATSANDASMDPTDQLPHAEELFPGIENPENQLSLDSEPPPKADTTFLAASIDGSIRIWDKRQPTAVAKITPQNAPPWCMNATWSPDGNFIFAGRRNGTVDEYSLHQGLQGASRSFKLPNNSGAVSALRALPNGRHLLW